MTTDSAPLAHALYGLLVVVQDVIHHLDRTGTMPAREISIPLREFCAGLTEEQRKLPRAWALIEMDKWFQKGAGGPPPRPKWSPEIIEGGKMPDV